MIKLFFLFFRQKVKNFNFYGKQTESCSTLLVKWLETFAVSMMLISLLHCDCMALPLDFVAVGGLLKILIKYFF